MQASQQPHTMLVLHGSYVGMYLSVTQCHNTFVGRSLSLQGNIWVQTQSTAGQFWLEPWAFTDRNLPLLLGWCLGKILCLAQCLVRLVQDSVPSNYHRCLFFHQLPIKKTIRSTATCCPAAAQAPPPAPAHPLASWQNLQEGQVCSFSFERLLVTTFKRQGEKEREKTLPFPVPFHQWPEGLGQAEARNTPQVSHTEHSGLSDWATFGCLHRHIIKNCMLSSGNLNRCS